MSIEETVEVSYFALNIPLVLENILDYLDDFKIKVCLYIALYGHLKDPYHYANLKKLKKEKKKELMEDARRLNIKFGFFKTKTKSERLSIIIRIIKDPLMCQTCGYYIRKYEKKECSTKGTGFTFGFGGFIENLKPYDKRLYNSKLSGRRVCTSCIMGEITKIHCNCGLRAMAFVVKRDMYAYCSTQILSPKKDINNNEHMKRLVGDCQYNVMPKELKKIIKRRRIK